MLDCLVTGNMSFTIKDFGNLIEILLDVYIFYIRVDTPLMPVINEFIYTFI